MKRTNGGIIAATLAASLPLAAQAQTSFIQKRIAVAGNLNVNAAAINNRGAIVASVFDTANGTQSGVVINGAAVTVLPAPYQGSSAPIPRAINTSGDVLGYAYEGIQPHMFLWQAGQYQPQDDVTLVIEQQAGPPPLPIGLTRADAVFYTIITGQNNPTDPIYGKLPNVRSMPTLLRYQTAHGLNPSGMLAGTSFYEGSSEAFVGYRKHFTALLPPGAIASNGGFINDAGEVAGAYRDGSNTQHGFTYLNGAYTTFDLPEAAAPYSLAITAINNAGRVASTYTSAATNRQHAFLYNGSTVNIFGSYSNNDDVLVALNDRGAIIVSRQIQQAATNYFSYRVFCRGTGC